MFNLKKIISLFLIIVTIFAMLPNVVMAEEPPISQELLDYGAQIYRGARSHFSRGSFSGYCGTYVRCQLLEMGIFNTDFEFHGNGNMWYNGLKDWKSTPTGYYVYNEDGGDCLTKLADKYGNDLKNIVLSLPVQANYSSRYPGAGHTFIIYELKDGIAYYSESFSFGSHREGTVIAEPADELIARYSKRHGSPSGCVMFSSEDLDAKLAREQGVLTEEQKGEILAIIENLSDYNYLANQVLNNTQAILA